MVTRQHASKARRVRSRALEPSAGRQDRRSGKTRPLEYAYGVPVPDGLHEAIEAERDNLSRVESILACMVVSMECQSDPLSGPYYPDVAQIARELVERSIDGLDPFVLKQRLSNKVEEDFRTSFADQAYPLLHRSDSRQALIGSFAACG